MSSVIRLRIQCPDDIDHAKILRIHGHGRQWTEDLAKLLCGTSPYYIFKPGERSPIGKCGLCGAQLEYSIEEFASEEAEIANV